MIEHPHAATSHETAAAGDPARALFDRCGLRQGGVIRGWTIGTAGLSEGGSVARASFSRGDTTVQVRFRRAGDEPCFARLGPVAVVHDEVDPTLTRELGAMLRRVVTHLERQGAHLDLAQLLSAPPPVSAAPAPDASAQQPEPVAAEAAETSAETSEGRELNLFVGSPCAQRCQFCSLPEGRFGTGVEDGQHQQLLAALDGGRARGATVLRVNGIEPLNYPLIAELIEAASGRGFEEAVLFTTAVPLADPDLARRVVAALPPRRQVRVPLYGVSAAVHDDVTAQIGSFAKVMRALENLSALLDPTDVLVTSVVVRANLHQVAAVRDLAAGYGFAFHANLPFPNPGYGVDAYNRCAPTYTEAVRTLHAASPPVPVREAPPCVLWRHERETGCPSLSQISPFHLPLEGRGYLDPKYIHDRRGSVAERVVPAVRCAAAECCGLADRCHQEVYSAYADLHGLGELAPIVPDAIER